MLRCARVSCNLGICVLLCYVDLWNLDHFIFLEIKLWTGTVMRRMTARERSSPERKGALMFTGGTVNLQQNQNWCARLFLEVKDGRSVFGRRWCVCRCSAVFRPGLWCSWSQRSRKYIFYLRSVRLNRRIKSIWPAIRQTPNCWMSSSYPQWNIVTALIY